MESGTSTSPGRFLSRCFDPGNSHSRETCPLLAIPDAPPACIRHRRRASGNLAKYNVRTHPETSQESLAPSPLQKEINPTSVELISFWNPATSYSPGRFRPRCFAHWARAGGNLVKYNVCTHLETSREKQFPEGKEISPAIRLSLFLWNPATSYSPGPSPGKYHRR